MSESDSYSKVTRTVTKTVVVTETVEEIVLTEPLPAVYYLNGEVQKYLDSNVSLYLS